MASMYVANATLQNYEINYRLPGEMMGVRVLRVPAGCQVKFPEDLDDEQVQSLAEHLERFGGAQVTDIDAIIVPRALVYSVKKPIPTEKIDEAGYRDRAARQEVAAQKTEEAGLASFSQIASTGTPVHETSLEVQQLNTQGDAMKGGVDAEIVVSTSAGKRQESTRQSRRR